MDRSDVTTARRAIERLAHECEVALQAEARAVELDNFEHAAAMADAAADMAERALWWSERLAQRRAECAA